MVSMEQATVPADLETEIAAPLTFESFFLDEHRQLRAAVWLIVRDTHEAEEIVQDAFVRVWERWERVASMDDSQGYLYRTAMNVLRNRRRRAAVAVRHLVRPAKPDDTLEAVERREVLVRALSSLTRRERAAVVLVDLLELSSEEAGSALGIKPSTVRVLASRGRERMRQEADDDA